MLKPTHPWKVIRNCPNWIQKNTIQLNSTGTQLDILLEQRFQHNRKDFKRTGVNISFHILSHILLLVTKQKIRGRNLQIFYLVLYIIVTQKSYAAMGHQFFLLWSSGEIWIYFTWGEISDFSTSVMNINLKCLHLTNFSPHISFVIFVTNIRYAGARWTGPMQPEADDYGDVYHKDITFMMRWLL